MNMRKNTSPGSLFGKRGPVLLLFMGCWISSISLPYIASPAMAQNPDQERLEAFLAEVYQTMDDNYYKPVSPAVYGKVLEVYTAQRLKKLNEINKKADDFVHLGAGLMVDKLKHENDRFSNFIPPKKTEEFKQKAYAITYDLGLEGFLTTEGYELKHVEKHTDAYAEGIREGDILKKIDDQPVTEISEEDIVKYLTPAEGTKVTLEIFFSKTGEMRLIVLESKTYFKETVFQVDSDIPGVLIEKIRHFNQKTSHDLGDDMSEFGLDKLRHLIIDLRDNEGGPPLAAREVLGFFTEPNDPLFAIARRKKRPVLLTSPTQEIRYSGPATVLINSRTGSAAETLSGIMQAKGIARLAGSQTAGATYLKNIFDFDDGSALFILTSETYFFNRQVFPHNGLTPDIVVPEEEDALNFVMNGLREEIKPSS